MVHFQGSTAVITSGAILEFRWTQRNIILSILNLIIEREIGIRYQRILILEDAWHLKLISALNVERLVFISSFARCLLIDNFKLCILIYSFRFQRVVYTALNLRLEFNISSRGVLDRELVTHWLLSSRHKLRWSWKDAASFVCLLFLSFGCDRSWWCVSPDNRKIIVVRPPSTTLVTLQFNHPYTRWVFSALFEHPKWWVISLVSRDFSLNVKHERCICILLFIERGGSCHDFRSSLIIFLLRGLLSLRWRLFSTIINDTTLFAEWGIVLFDLLDLLGGFTCRSYTFLPLILPRKLGRHNEVPRLLRIDWRAIHICSRSKFRIQYWR